MWVHWLLLGTCDYIDRNIYNVIYCAITFNLHDKLFHSFATIVVFNNGIYLDSTEMLINNQWNQGKMTHYYSIYVQNFVKFFVTLDT